MYYILRLNWEIFNAKVKDVIIDSVYSLVNEVNFDFEDASLNMKEEGFEEYRCDKNTLLGLHLLDFGKY